MPEIPYKPNSAEDKQEEDLRARRAEAAERERLKNAEDPNRVKDAETKATTNEFNMLAELIC